MPIRPTQSARAHDQHLGRFQLLLARPANLAQHQMAGIAFDFGFAEHHQASPA
jgi:hypothetical protein